MITKGGFSFSLPLSLSHTHSLSNDVLSFFDPKYKYRLSTLYVNTLKYYFSPDLG